MTVTKAIYLSLALLSTAAKADTYKLVTLDFPPLEYAGEKGQPAGAAVEIVIGVLQKLGHKAMIDVLPWTRSVVLVKEGRADAIFTAYKNADREAFLDYGKEVLIPQVVSLYVKKGSTLGFDGSMASLRSSVVGTVSTISYGERFDAARAAGTVKTERADALELNLKKLAAGRLDYVVSNRFSAQAEIERLGLEQSIVELPTPVEVIPSYIAYSKKNKLTALRDAMDKGLREMKKSGRYQEILNKFKVRIPKEGS